MFCSDGSNLERRSPLRRQRKMCIRAGTAVAPLPLPALDRDARSRRPQQQTQSRHGQKGAPVALAEIYAHGRGQAQENPLHAERIAQNGCDESMIHSMIPLL